MTAAIGHEKRNECNWGFDLCASVCLHVSFLSLSLSLSLSRNICPSVISWYRFGSLKNCFDVLLLYAWLLLCVFLWAAAVSSSAGDRKQWWKQLSEDGTGSYTINSEGRRRTDSICKRAAMWARDLIASSMQDRIVLKVLARRWTSRGMSTQAGETEEASLSIIN